jgi:xanthine dehydrogenase accessory factor
MALNGGLSWAAAALGLLDARRPAAMVTQVAVVGSTPREAGVRMIVGLDCFFGTIGGGNLELTAIDQARRLLAQTDIDVLQQDYPLGPLLAQCCGGRVRLLVERLNADSSAWLAVADAAEQHGKPYTLSGEVVNAGIRRTVHQGWLDEEFAGAALLDRAGRPADWKTSWTRIVERIQPVATPLFLFGAGHVGRAVANIAATLPFRLVWTDSREEMLGQARLQVEVDPVRLVGTAPAGAFFLVMTHAHELDYALVRAILARSDAAFCGLIGSATKRARFASRLAKDGLDASMLTCPVGLGAIRSKSPASIAVAVAADLLVRLEGLSVGP